MNAFSLLCALLSNQCGKKRSSGRLGPGIWRLQAQCSTEMVPEEDRRLCGKGQCQPCPARSGQLASSASTCSVCTYALMGQCAYNCHLSFFPRQGCQAEFAICALNIGTQTKRQVGLKASLHSIQQTLYISVDLHLL